MHLIQDKNIFQLQEWRKLLIKKKKPYIHSRRFTLPDLTLARHARKESLAEATQKLSSKLLIKLRYYANNLIINLTILDNSRKPSQCSISQFRSTRKTLIETNDELLGDIKRVRIIRRRH